MGYAGNLRTPLLDTVCTIRTWPLAERGVRHLRELEMGVCRKPKDATSEGRVHHPDMHFCAQGWECARGARNALLESGVCQKPKEEGSASALHHPDTPHFPQNFPLVGRLRTFTPCLSGVFKPCFRNP